MGQISRCSRKAFYLFISVRVLRLLKPITQLSGTLLNVTHEADRDLSRHSFDLYAMGVTQLTSSISDGAG